MKSIPPVIKYCDMYIKMRIVRFALNLSERN